MTSGDRQPKSAAEWVTLSLSALIVGSLIVVALVEESRREDVDAVELRISFDEEQASTQGENYFLPYTIRNTGSTAISSAEIWIDTYAGEQVIESAEVTVQFLPLQGSQEGVFVTTHDPPTHTFVGRIESIQFP